MHQPKDTPVKKLIGFSLALLLSAAAHQASAAPVVPNMATAATLPALAAAPALAPVLTPAVLTEAGQASVVDVQYYDRRRARAYRRWRRAERRYYRRY